MSGVPVDVEWSAVAPLAASASFYVAGLARLWRASGVGRGIGAGPVACFASGWTALAVALLSPIDTLGGELFWVHMVQHETLMLVAAPLLVLGKPLQAWLWAFTPSVRQALARVGRHGAMSAAWSRLTSPAGGWTLHAATLWAWHLPVLFQAALVHPLLHDLQHVSFLGGALVFWWALFVARARQAWGAAVLYLFTTMLHTGALGALLTFARGPWYASYAATAPLHGLTALEDQQVGGLVMWVPGSLAYIGAALALLARILAPPRASLAADGLRKRVP